MRDHLPDLGVFGHHNARKRCAYHAVVHSLLGNRNARFGGRHLLLGKGNFCPQAVSRGAGVVEGFLRLDAGLPQLLGALQLNFGVAKLHFQICDRRLRSITIRLGGIQGAFVVGIVQRGK